MTCIKLPAFHGTCYALCGVGRSAGSTHFPHPSSIPFIDVPERVQYKLGVVMYSCLHGQSPRYLADLCVPVSDVSARHAASSIRYSASLGGSAMPAQHTRSTVLLCGRPVALELSTRQLERSGSWQGQRHTFAEDAEDASIFTVLIEAFSVLEMFRTIRSTNLLTYLPFHPSPTFPLSKLYCW